MTEFKRVFVDTSPIIYYLENSSLYLERIKSFFEKCIEEKIQIVTSSITIEEYLVFPYSSGKMEFADNFKRFIEYMNIEVVDINFTIAEQGAVNILISNNYPDLGEVLEQLGLSKYFEEVLISAVVGYNKPCREIFELANIKYPNAEIYMIGDNVNADILGGKQAGMKMILVHKGYSEHADYCFDDLKEILSLIE